MPPITKKIARESTKPTRNEYVKSFLTLHYRFTRREKNIAFYAALIAILLFSGGISLQKTFFSNKTISSTDLTDRSTRQVALTEQELLETVKALKINAYWTGPIEGSLYSLDTRGPGQVYVRYLPSENGLNDNSAAYRVIGTYQITDAYITTIAAGNSVPNSVGFINSDGAAVYYTKDLPNNVYLAFDGDDIQIEIFDPQAGVSMQLASTQGSITLIGS